jgi:hypothetical protein
LRHYRTRAENHAFAYDEVEARVSREKADLEDAWALVLALIETASDDREVGYVAAGPLENVVRRFGPALIDRIEAASHQDPKFRTALGAIYLRRDELTVDIVERLVRASNGTIRPLG